MFEISCASCQAPFEYNQEDYIHLCPYCSSGFIIDLEEGTKDLIGDHYIIPSFIEKDAVKGIFEEWISSRYHNPQKIKKEFKFLGCYGIMLPYWVVSAEAHTFWSGHSAKQNKYEGQRRDFLSGFVKEEGRFSRRYRWAILARHSPKEHWGLERLHHPRENINVDWEGFPLDESLGKPPDGQKPIYESRQPFRFEHATEMSVAGIQTKETSAINRVRDQINEYHRRISKTKIGTLYEYRTEIEIIGLHMIHIPFWIARYSYSPKSIFKYFTNAKEKRLVIQGYTGAIVEAELPLNTSDKTMINIILCLVLGFISLTLSVIFSPLFYLIFIVFLLISIFSAIRLVKNKKIDIDLVKGHENKEPVT